MKKIIIKNVRTVTPERILDHHATIVEGGVIRDVVPVEKLNDSFCFDAQLIDGGGLFLSPGFIDIHSHGGGGHDFMDGTPEAFLGACRTHAAYGTTTILPTSLTAGVDEIRKFFEAYRRAKSVDYEGADMPGVHLEGPFISSQFAGAQDIVHVLIPSPEIYEKIYEYSQGSIIRWTAAPELPGAGKFMGFLREKGIRGSIGHSAANYEQVVRAYEQGFSTITHLYSSMSTITRHRGRRVPGVVESAYLIDGISAELIADNCHLPAELLRLAYRSKGADRLALVTDSMRAAGMPEGESILGSLSNGIPVQVRRGVAYLPDGQGFAGSICTADCLVRTMVQQAGVPLCDAVKMASITPARLTGLDRTKGSIVSGKDADLVLFDGDIQIQMTLVKGKCVFDSRHSQSA